MSLETMLISINGKEIAVAPFGPGKYSRLKKEILQQGMTPCKSSYLQKIVRALVETEVDLDFGINKQKTKIQQVAYDFIYGRSKGVWFPSRLVFRDEGICVDDDTEPDLEKIFVPYDSMTSEETLRGTNFSRHQLMQAIFQNGVKDWDEELREGELWNCINLNKHERGKYHHFGFLARSHAGPLFLNVASRKSCWAGYLFGEKK